MQPTPLEMAYSMVDVAITVEDGDAEGLENWGISGYGGVGNAAAGTAMGEVEDLGNGDCRGTGGRLGRLRGVGRWKGVGGGGEVQDQLGG